MSGWRVRAGDALVVAQVALSVVVLVGAGLLVRTLHKLQTLDPGFDTQNVLPRRQGVDTRLYFLSVGFFIRRRGSASGDDLGGSKPDAEPL